MLTVVWNDESDQTKHALLDEISEDVLALRIKVKSLTDQVLKNKALCSLQILQNHLSEFKRGLCKYPLHDARPKVLHAYSLNDGNISFTFTSFHRNQKFRPDGYVDLMKGFSDYSNYEGQDLKSRGKNLLLTIVGYQSFLKNKNLLSNESANICDLDLFYDLYIGSQKTYWVVSYQGMLIFQPMYQNKSPQIEYMEQRFKAYLQGRSRPAELAEYRALIRGKMGRWVYQSMSTIDGYNNSAKDIPKLNASKDFFHYEILMVNPSDYDVDSEDFLLFDPYHNLCSLARFIPNFKIILDRILFKCHFGIKDNVILGLRNSDDYLFFTFELNVDNDIIPFMKQFYNSKIKKFEFFIDVVDKKLAEIHQMVGSHKSHDEEVLKLTCAHSPYVEREVLTNKKAIGNIIPVEYKTWMENSTDTLLSCRDIDIRLHLTGIQPKTDSCSFEYSSDECDLEYDLNPLRNCGLFDANIFNKMFKASSVTPYPQNKITVLLIGLSHVINGPVGLSTCYSYVYVPFPTSIKDACIDVTGRNWVKFLKQIKSFLIRNELDDIESDMVLTTGALFPNKQYPYFYN